MISLSGAGMAFGTQVLFENVSWRLQPGGHYGLVGANGTGKSTLLRIIAGELPAESGIVSRPNGLSIGTLGQDHFSFDAERPLDVVIGGRPSLHGALEEKAALLSRLGDQNPNEAEGLRLAELEAIIADVILGAPVSAAGRAHQSPGHRFDPLDGRIPARLRGSFRDRFP